MFDQEDGQKHCPQCRATMVLERVASNLEPLPEFRTYRCSKCCHVIKYQIERQTGWVQYVFDLKPSA